jgi:hypothetical protein
MAKAQVLTRTVRHHPFYYRRVHHEFHRRESLLAGFWIVLTSVLVLLVLICLITFLVQ